MIFTRDFVTRANYWHIASLVTPKSLFTATHAFFFFISNELVCIFHVLASQLQSNIVYHSINRDFFSSVAQLIVTSSPERRQSEAQFRRVKIFFFIIYGFIVSCKKCNNVCTVMGCLRADSEVITCQNLTFLASMLVWRFVCVRLCLSLPVLIFFNGYFDISSPNLTQICILVAEIRL